MNTNNNNLIKTIDHNVSKLTDTINIIDSLIPLFINLEVTVEKKTYNLNGIASIFNNLSFELSEVMEQLMNMKDEL